MTIRITLPDSPVRRFVSRYVPRDVVAFAAVGTAGTVAYLALYLAMRMVTGATAANLVAQVLSTVLSTWLHRRYTARLTVRSAAVRHQLQMLGLLAVNLVLNTAALAALDRFWPSAGSVVELGVLLLSGSVVTLARFALLRAWAARAHSGRDGSLTTLVASGSGASERIPGTTTVRDGSAGWGRPGAGGQGGAGGTGAGRRPIRMSIASGSQAAMTASTRASPRVDRPRFVTSPPTMASSPGLAESVAHARMALLVAV
jgi:putative flippase GtrA